eukprot:g12280.t1
MALSLERGCVEAVFFVALAVATAVLHYARGFSPAFASLSSQPAAAAVAASNSPLFNYACLLATAIAAYAAARTVACHAAVAVPPKVKSSAAVRRGALALILPATLVICYVGAGYPPLGGSVAVKWLAGNWERNGERDLGWCGRLFALLFFWQALLAAGIAACRALVGSVTRLVTGGASRSNGSGAGIGGKRGKKLELDRSSDSSEMGSFGDGALPTVGSREKEKEKPRPTSGENGAPGWEKERDGTREAPFKA